jgi:putative addiction module component (TIGR02574 family)
MIKTKALFDEAISLPIEIRMQLVEKLLRSLNPTQKEIDKLWAKEAERRIEEIKSGKVKTI